MGAIFIKLGRAPAMRSICMDDSLVNEQVLVRNLWSQGINFFREFIVVVVSDETSGEFN